MFADQKLDSIRIYLFITYTLDYENISTLPYSQLKIFRKVCPVSEPFFSYSELGKTVIVLKKLGIHNRVSSG